MGLKIEGQSDYVGGAGVQDLEIRTGTASPLSVNRTLSRRAMTTNFRATASSTTRLTPIGLDDPTGQGLAMAYKIGAGECLGAARELLKHPIYSDGTGNYIIALHAIELALKAFLVARGYTEKELKGKSFGHDLNKLYAAAKRHGLKLETPNADELIAWSNEWHAEGVKIRYEFARQRALPLCETLVNLASEVIKKIIWTNRVTLLNPDGTVFEVHSVGIGANAYVYAAGLVERDAREGKPPRTYVVENDGVKATETAERVLAFAKLAIKK